MRPRREDAFEDVVAALAKFADSGSTEAAGIVSTARSRADMIADVEEDRDEAGRFAALLLVADVLADLSVAHGWARDETDCLIEHVADETGVARPLVAAQIHLLAARDPRLLELPPALAFETQLRMLVALAPVAEASLWSTDEVGRLRCLGTVGGSERSRPARSAARSLLGLGPATEKSKRTTVQAVPVLRWQRPQAALVIRPSRGDGEEALVYAQETARALAPVLEREDLLDRSAARERSLVESSERRLTRLGFDLHDGPIQELVALAGDLRLLKRAFVALADGEVRLETVADRIDDLDSRLIEIDGELRELARSLESPTIARRPLPDALEGELETFRAQCDIDATIEVRGEHLALTPSQRIALIRIVQEALSNIRDHSGAKRVSVSVSVRRSSVHAEIVDDGRGFVVERTLVRAARRGRLGLVGMSERVRLLGGRFDVDSRPGGPTAISVVLPRWEPQQALAARADTAVGVG